MSLGHRSGVQNGCSFGVIPTAFLGIQKAPFEALFKRHSRCTSSVIQAYITSAIQASVIGALGALQALFRSHSRCASATIPTPFKRLWKRRFQASFEAPLEVPFVESFRRHRKHHWRHRLDTIRAPFWRCR